ncbi:tyrosine-protein kinase transmembrane modulator EpsC [Liquorilactobacillus sucicola DSM 21376 = JCM 15457]|uniref:Capsular polysaccharide biosynthesis protein CpsC n=1 Tax=Liquorilactobacillus sucicola DSM 21376 = JCM 15457 TaxID=1423806 RepID=A0A023CXF1_9LACO|nr:Wzz/FepE/Etk N-terminal domain-containing protein [Liquorilactobacillus sucicola]KRN06305.1 Exopolysaccharide chain length regulator [Liquorilactobacillus sucicola DSM 21376 = JCM 15457]GAJ26246.1 tyrosine-protein kinase transmembrane modulator EpsC [Liquorilactobacillus sucicola DSM 21376 = JCM 15457]
MIEQNNNETLIDIRQLGRLLRKNIISLIMWMVAGVLVSLIVSFVFMSPKYSATTDLLVSQKVNNEQIQFNIQQADLQAINTYKDVLKKDVILSPVLREIRRNNNYSGDLEDLAKAISIENQTNSQVISISVTDKNAYTAADIANTVGDVFSKKIKKMMKVDNVAVVTKATVDTEPVSPNKKINTLVGLLLGLIIGVAIIVVRSLLDTTVKDEKYLTDEIGLVSLGTISHMSKKTNRHAVSVLSSGSKVAPRRRV